MILSIELIREVLERESLVIFRRNQSKSKALAIRQWASHFGTSLEVCVMILYGRRSSQKGDVCREELVHLLWGLYLLKVYGTGDTSSSNVGGVDDKTWRKWTELFVDAISYLEYDVVSLSSECELVLLHHSYAFFSDRVGRKILG